MIDLIEIKNRATKKYFYPSYYRFYLVRDYSSKGKIERKLKIIDNKHQIVVDNPLTESQYKVLKITNEIKKVKTDSSVLGPPDFRYIGESMFDPSIMTGRTIITTDGRIIRKIMPGNLIVYKESIYIYTKADNWIKMN